MSATEIIKAIQKLPASEQEQVLNFLQSARGKREAAGTKVRYVSDSDFDKAADKVLREHAELFRRLAR